MVVVVDTDLVDPNDRAAAVAEAVLSTTAPAHFELGPADGGIYARVDAAEFGSVSLVRGQMSGWRLVRTAGQVRRSPCATVAVNLQLAAPIRVARRATQWTIRPGELYPVDLDAPFDLDWTGGGSAAALYVPVERLELPPPTVEKALARQARQSPLHSLVANHIRSMSSIADSLSDDHGATDLGNACVDLIRALFTSLADDAPADGTAVPGELLRERIRDYIRDHLTDADLGPATVARAHHISVRYLYKLWEPTGSGFEQWIIDQRLEFARNQLTDPGLRHRSIAAIALGSGFRDPSHFTRRFRTAYGMTPRDWRHTRQRAE
ncbi:helix-turn-helix domain-containing protein [Nocardia sp. CDC159]|uniref:Helix-turn-helix domain-containing protein n=1 Tax=Nocardia pulmonis TaxID=2951408 RepID=A0A9X2E0L7_9NOCA|nr:MULTISPECIES: helix-turn-helix domain-containing protein [Nocardia]MCM6771987.1 helix-turn-helix domain-containing protein [Nocardia pulmonis]MCM6785355.1 helix-turn-helix domain-containing protein [Nocardia sp. CDC159]